MCRRMQLWICYGRRGVGSRRYQEPLGRSLAGPRVDQGKAAAGKSSHMPCCNRCAGNQRCRSDQRIEPLHWVTCIPTTSNDFGVASRRGTSKRQHAAGKFFREQSVDHLSETISTPTSWHGRDAIKKFGLRDARGVQAATGLRGHPR